MLEISGLTKKYGDVVALDRVSLSLSFKKTHVLLGSSGSGKSTLLRAILGLVRCDEGEISIAGESVSKLSTRERARRLGYVPQDGGLFPHMSALENASIVAKSQGWPVEKIAARARELSSVVSLDPSLFGRYPGELSGGQKQRVALMRAAFMDPEILIFDEPLGALDPLIRADLQYELKKIFSKLEKTVVFVTHDLAEAAYLGDQIILMNEGRVVQVGTYMDLRDRPAISYVERFLNAYRGVDRGPGRG